MFVKMRRVIITILLAVIFFNGYCYATNYTDLSLAKRIKTVHDSDIVGRKYPMSITKSLELVKEIRRVSKEFNLDNELLLAISETEGNYVNRGKFKDGKLKDGSHRYGLGIYHMQVSTAKWLWKIAKIEEKFGVKYSDEKVIDPLQWGTYLAGYYVKYQLERYKGNLDKSIVAYNKGNALKMSLVQAKNHFYRKRVVSKMSQYKKLIVAKSKVEDELAELQQRHDDKQRMLAELIANEKYPQQRIISEFEGAYFFLSNFYNCNVYHNGQLYRNSEAAFQASKTKDTDFRLRFAELPPNEARKLGKSAEMRRVMRPDWDAVKVNVMRSVVEHKFEQNRALRRNLLATNDALLQEGNWWGDDFWGIYQGRGENWLGRILMDLREHFKKMSEVNA